METISVLLPICAGNSPMSGEFRAQRQVTRMFSLICARINSWVNNREAGDLRRHRAHYDFSVMWYAGFEVQKVFMRLLFLAVNAVHKINVMINLMLMPTFLPTFTATRNHQNKILFEMTTIVWKSKKKIHIFSISKEMGGIIVILSCIYKCDIF